ncbi:uncharacterized protein LOC133885914 [Phragmites australis]|uniref:uncharacterized protein LOC133885914 n=1 Tax=Phragmites australis TaxID=29695 RepID=UPI002D7A1BFC|nr:uncharacterized protein LOC133885914 [Phragmites australis]
MALSLSCGTGRRRWMCRAVCRGGNGGAGCRHFHVHHHFPRQVCAFSSLRLLPRFSLLPFLLILPVLFFAVLAFLVWFGWFTLVYFVSSLLSKDNNHACFKSGSVNHAGDVRQLRGEGEQGGKKEDRDLKRVTESGGDSAVPEVCVQRMEIKEAFVDGFFDESRDTPRTVSPDACFNEEDQADDEKLVEEVTIFEANRNKLQAISDIEGSSERRQVHDLPFDWFLEELNIKEFSTSRDTEKLEDLQNGEQFTANRKDVSAFTSSKFFEFIDKHETRVAVINGSANGYKIRELTSSDDSVHDGLGNEHKEIKQQQNIKEFSVNILANELSEDVKQHEIQKVVTDHNNKLPEEDIMEENGKQIVSTSDEVRDFNNESETLWLPLDSVCENKYTTVADSNASFHPTNTDEDVEHEEELTVNNRVEASSSTSLVCNFAENHQANREEIDVFTNDDNIREVASLTEDEDEKSNDNCTSQGEPRRLPHVRRSPPPWWNLCGVLDVFAVCKD